MAPGRKKGANKLKTAKELSLGDLVLAKVKGFPAWPAKVGRPEDWDRASDPKKYFVQFFGTQEIAFVSPADIQTFTSESKSKLLTRCKGKTVKYFAQAVKEICAAFDELQGNNSVDDPNHDVVPCDVSNTEGMEVDGLDLARKKDGEIAISGVADGAVEQDGCSNRQDRTRKMDYIISSTFEEYDGSSLAISDKKASIDIKGIEEVERLPTECKNKQDGSCERLQSARASTSSPYSALADVKRDVHYGLTSEDNNKNSLESSARSKVLTGRSKVSMAGDKPNDLDTGSKRKLDGLTCDIDVNKSGTPVHDGRKTVIGEKTTKLLIDEIKSESSISGRKVKNLLADKRNLVVSKNSHSHSHSHSHKDVVIREHVDSDQSNMRNSAGLEKYSFPLKDRSDSTKRTKHAGLMYDVVEGSIVKSEKNDLEPLHVAEGKISEPRISVDSKAEDHSGSKAQDDALRYISGDDDELPVAKRQRRVTEPTVGPTVSLSGDKKSLVSVTRKNESKKRRAIRLYDDEEDDEPKTPLHGGFSHKFNASASASYSMRTSNGNHRNTDHTVQTLNDLAGCEKDSPEEHVLSIKSHTDSTKPIVLAQPAVRSNSSQLIRSPRMLESGTQSYDESKLLLTSLKKSPQVPAVSAKVLQEQKADRLGVAGTQFSAQATSDICSNVVSDTLNSSQIHISVKKNRPSTGGEKLKGTPRMVSQLHEPAGPVENQRGVDLMMDGSAEDLSTNKTGLSVDFKIANSALSMKHLIAAAQAKRRQAQVQNLSHGSSTFVAPSADIQGRSPSPSFPSQPFLTGESNATELGSQGTASRANFLSPSSHVHPFASQNHLDTEDHDGDKKAISGHEATGGSNSGGTEAAVARDAFEGMIETLSRTKESIGRATRLALDCAKYGIANEVVDLLVRKLESESSFHRRVDLFFLVDSITQCSHSQKGVAGASYIPAVQAALTHILEAAAPSGGSARENRRQCLKVLRLWLERKILPEAILCRHIETIEEMSRHPSRIERAVDDPIREMEGILVDEYGSNATFQLPGFMPSCAFNDDDEEDEEDAPSASCKRADCASALESIHISTEINASLDTPNDRHPHILEDVDGELEMEDVSGHQKDQGALPPSGASEVDAQEFRSSRDMDLTEHHDETLSLDGSPPLPLESPPSLPPLPSSPPPPPPPPLSPSPPPPPPPPPSLASLPSQPPPPPAPSLHSAPPHPGHLAPLLPCQQSISPQVLPQVASAHPLSQVAYQAPASQEYSSQPSGNQLVVQQPPCFLPVGLTDNSPRPLEYGHNDFYMNAHATQANQQLPSGHTQFGHVAFNQNPPQPIGGHFPYNKPAIRQHFQQPYMRPFSSSSSSTDGRTRFADEQWRATSGEFKADNQHGTWMNGGRAPSSITTFGGEGYFCPERPSTNNMGFQFSASNPPSSVAPAPGHPNNQMLPSRPDMSALNCWRPA